MVLQFELVCPDQMLRSFSRDYYLKLLLVKHDSDVIKEYLLFLPDQGGDVAVLVLHLVKVDVVALLEIDP